MKFFLCTLMAIFPMALGFVVPAASGNAFTAAASSRVVFHALPPAIGGEKRVTARPTTAMSMERSYIMIKPDGVQRGLVGTIISRFEQRGYKLAALKMKQADESLLKTHYKDLVEKPFFPKLLAYMLSGPVVCMAWEGREAVAMGRKMLGATNPLESAPGTIRGDYSLEVGRNICHGSDSVENAEREIALWFDPAELIDHESAMKDWIYE
ncbi:unnamed protein product [Ascophyllum nodosum]